ncbi:hypothetical protein PGT21_030146 [Puccinia graminis f. sp. tritici]|uniref:Uncharacterized protein n=1 Tax=Puccinia graminis f. sp. tritici TaxID=56615 RepID=A0A5B0QQ87_PUCGR|nr:hypothetical protein PGT21_030146 [Puccinia graminis f. sp. tritici]
MMLSERSTDELEPPLFPCRQTHDRNSRFQQQAAGERKNIESGRRNFLEKCKSLNDQSANRTTAVQSSFLFLFFTRYVHITFFFFNRSDYYNVLTPGTQFFQ